MYLVYHRNELFNLLTSKARWQVFADSINGPVATAAPCTTLKTPSEGSQRIQSPISVTAQR
jgi:hypothetical protein